MRILVICKFNQNRSVTLAGQLKWLGNDVLTAGTATNNTDTLQYLSGWAELIVTVDQDTYEVMAEMSEATTLWDIGPDVYPRPYNKDLLQKCKEFIFQHPEVDNRPITKTHPEKGIKDPRKEPHT